MLMICLNFLVVGTFEEIHINLSNPNLSSVCPMIFS